MCPACDHFLCERCTMQPNTEPPTVVCDNCGLALPRVDWAEKLVKHILREHRNRRIPSKAKHHEQQTT